jgi:hypothetical protein
VRNPAVLFLHLTVTAPNSSGPGGAHSVVAESVPVKQLLILNNRSRKRALHLCLTDRLVIRVRAPLMRQGRLVRSAIVLKPFPSRQRNA